MMESTIGRSTADAWAFVNAISVGVGPLIAAGRGLTRGVIGNDWGASELTCVDARQLRSGVATLLPQEDRQFRSGVVVLLPQFDRVDRQDCSGVPPKHVRDERQPRSGVVSLAFPPHDGRQFLSGVLALLPRGVEPLLAVRVTAAHVIFNSLR